MKSRHIKYNLLKVAFFALPFTTLTACSDLLEPTPETAISDKNAFDTPERIQGQMNGLYDNAKSGQFLGGRYLVYNDIRAEEFINRLTNGFTGFSTWNHTLTSGATEVENVWGTAYATINRINVFLKGLDDNASKIDPILLAQYRGEAKFLRALTYFDLVVLYAKPYNLNNGTSPGLPLRLQAETTSDNNDLERSTVAQVYAQILKDLDEAEAGLPASYATPALNVTRAHKNAAIALKTRVNLNKGDYAKVVTEAQKIVSATPPFKAATGVAHELQANAAAPFTTFTTTESVFSFPMTDSDAPGTQNQLGYYYNAAPVGNGEYYLNPAGILGNTEWRATDVRKANMLTVTGGNTYSKKFSKPAPFTDWVPMIRYAEVLLNYAEAAARTNDLAKATQLLSAVRNRADASYVFPAAAVATQDALVNTILTERRIELLAEGFRSLDLLRLGQSIPAKSNVNAISPTQVEYIWPIPQSELLANKKMTAN
ncbi:MAG TPA: RagB/SusD family nutrient uptake outer membrane protein [Sphingobacteriaceae bacterium]